MSKINRLRLKVANRRYSQTTQAILPDTSADTAQTNQSKAALRESESFYRQMFERNAAVKLVIDPSTAQIIEANQAACDFYGYTREQFKSMRVMDISTTSELNLLADMQRTVTNKGKIFQTRHRLASGAIRDVEIFPGTLAVNGKVYLYAIVQDITERKQTEKALRKSEELHWLVTQHMPNSSVVMYDNDLRYTFAEGPYLKNFGEIWDNAIGKQPKDMYSEEALNYLLPIYKRALQGENFTFERVTPNYAYESYVAPVNDDKGNIIGGIVLSHDITKRKQAEKALRESETLYRLFAQHMPNTSVIMFDTDKHFTLAEGDFLKRVGLNSENMIGKTPEEVFPEETLHFMQPIYQRVLAGEAFDYDRTTPDYAYQAYANPLKNADGQIIGGLFLSHDITEAKRTEAALRASEEHFHSLLNLAPVGIIQNDAQGKRIFCNSRWSEITGMSLDEALAATYDPLYPDDRTVLAAAMKKMTETHLPIDNIVLRYQHRDGTLVWVSGNTKPLFDEQGELTSYIGVLTDITEQKHLEEELRASEERFHSLVDLAPVGIIQTETNRKRIFCNTRWCEMVGITLEEALSDTDYVTIYPDDLPTASGAWETMMETHLPFDNVIFRYQRPDKSTVWVSGNGRPLYDADGAITGYLGSVTDITERKQLEDALITSESRFRSLIDIAPVGIVETDANGAILLGNEYWSNLSGISEDQALLNNAFRTLHPDDFERVIAINKLMLETIAPVSNIEYRFVHPDGKTVWVSGSSRPMFDADKALTGYIITMSDITERKLLEDALVTSESRFRTLVDFAPVGIVETDAQGMIILGNVHWYALSGLSLERAFVDNGSETVHPDDLAMIQAINQKMVESNTYIDNIEYRFLHPDGKIVWVSDSSRPLTDSNGTVTGFIVTMTDITERKRLENALRQNEERLQNITDNLEDLVSQIDGEAHFVFASPSYHTLLGYEPKSLIGTSSLEMVHPDDFADMKKTLQTALETGAPQYSVEGRIRHADGHYISVEIVGKPFFDSKSNFAGGIFVSRDISERKRMQNLLLEKEKLQTALDKELELNNLKTRMMNRIAHEFRTPLTVIQAATETLTHYLDRLTAEQRDAKEVTIKGQIQRLVSMLDEIGRVVNSDFTPDKIRRTSTDVSALCRQIAARLERDLNQPGKFVLDLPERTEVLVDPQILSNAFMHVMHNAARFSKPDATVQVSLSRAETGITLRVIDTGIGILPNEHPRIFEPFFRGNNIGESSGLGVGLTITRAAIEAHGGTISVDSELGQGTTVTIWLPV